MAVIDRLNVNYTPAFLKDGVFDISEYNNGAVYTDLSDALGQNGANIPPTIRKGGMSVKFIMNNSNYGTKYVQYRYTNDSIEDASFVNTKNWVIAVEDKFIDTILTPTETTPGGNSISLADGSIVTSTSNTTRVKTYSIDPTKSYKVSGRRPGTSGLCMVAYYASDSSYIGYELGHSGSAVSIIDYTLTIPSNAAFVKISGNTNNQDGELKLNELRHLQQDVSELQQDVTKLKEDATELQQNASELQQDVAELQQDVTDINDAIKVKTIEVETPTATHDGKALQSNGQLRDSTSGSINPTVHDFNIDPTKNYLATGWCPSTESDNVLAAFYDNNDAFISAINPSPRSGLIDYSLTIPNNASIFRIFGRAIEYQPQLKLVTEENVDLEELNEDVTELKEDVTELKEDVTELKEDVTELQNQAVPQIFNNQIQRKSLSETVKILCFGSSWFMDTWWYLNKIIQSAGINAELHCYYIGHSRFNEWIDLYKNDLTPFSGSEASRSASKNISINGADWTITTYRSNYTAQQFRDDWYNDFILEDWDIIALQQGARQAPYWDLYWKDYWSELVKIVKTHCNPNTVIAFNSTWTPAVQDSVELSPWPATREGQMGWQEANWKNTKKFMRLSGIYNVSPNGKTMYLLRNSELNTETDLADDGLHPNNGLPIYALGGTFFETYIAPMYGISFKTVEWVPTTSTQKASVSKQSWTPVSSSDSALVKNIIKQALSDRFKF